MNKRILFLILLAALLLVAADAEPAPDITDRAVISVSANSRQLTLMLDDDYRTEWATDKKGAGIEVLLPDDSPCCGVYLNLGGTLGRMEVQAPDGRGWKTVTEPVTVQPNQLFEVPGLTHFRVYCPKGRLRVIELRLFGPGELPEYVCRFQKSLDKTDMLVMSCHPDDDILWYGGLLPTYAGEYGMDIQVVYMCHRFSYRRCEAMDALWHCGVRRAPIFMGFKDIGNADYEHCVAGWGGIQSTARRIARVIRQVRPEVVISQDIEGEYGHHQHVAMTAACGYAVKLAADPTQRTLKDLPVWEVKKYYVHLGENDPLILDYDRPLTAFGGKTGLTVAREAFLLHRSQQTGRYSVEAEGPYDCRKFGLEYSSVGGDERHDGLFEHIPGLYERETGAPQAGTV